MTVVAVMPIKQLENAKQRLAGMLSAAERSELFTAMVRDVLETVIQCANVDRSLVITSDEAVAQLALEYGAEVLPEPETPGLIPAVTAAAEVLRERGVEVMLFLPGDVPLVTEEELNIVLADIEQATPPHMTIAPAGDLGGSNCVACCPPDCMPFGFGVDSFRRHLRLAREAGVAARVTKLPGVGLDIDTPEDLAELTKQIDQRGDDSHTGQILKALAIRERLQAGTAAQA